MKLVPNDIFTIILFTQYNPIEVSSVWYIKSHMTIKYHESLMATKYLYIKYPNTACCFKVLISDNGQAYNYVVLDLFMKFW